jgi:hypothetical protein
MIYKSRVGRRSKDEIAALKALLLETARGEAPTTIRHLFYCMVVAGAIEKSEAEYHNVVIRLATEMRMSGELPFSYIADSTRFVHEPAAYDSLEEGVRDAARSYRKNLWLYQPAICETWVEKDAMRAVVSPVTWEYDVPLMLCRGFPSLSFLYSTWQTIEMKGKPTHIYILSDFDRSGYRIDENIRQRLSYFTSKFGGPPVSFERLAVTEEQVEALNLPTRPPKPGERDGFSRNVELDAMNSNYVRGLVRDAIERHLPAGELARLKEVEAIEREQFLGFAHGLRSNPEKIGQADAPSVTGAGEAKAPLLD